ncbi:hypothetical protein ACFOSD_08240 [Salinispirillum marinum]|uniref:Uncharacterized protein n=2 Tax=Saccharospirillaceae TaxID=255527 RepID=A0ABV8BG57_9GAMM
MPTLRPAMTSEKTGFDGLSVAPDSARTRSFCLMHWATLGLLSLLAGCNPDPMTSDYATDELHLNLLVMRHNDQLVVQTSLTPHQDLGSRAQLADNEALLVRINGQEYPLAAQWNGVYSNEIPYQEGTLELDFVRPAQTSALNTWLHLPVSPEFYSPESNEIFETQSDQVIPLSWSGIATENGRYEVRCSSMKQGIAESSGVFQAINRQAIELSIDELMAPVIRSQERAFCQVIFTLRGVSNQGLIAPELSGGDVHFESHVSRTIIVRHNALFRGEQQAVLH